MAAIEAVDTSFKVEISKKSFIKSIEAMRKLCGQHSDHVIVTIDKYGICFRTCESDKKCATMTYFNRYFFDSYVFLHELPDKCSISIKQLSEKIKPYSTHHIRTFTWSLDTTGKMTFEGDNPNGKAMKDHMYVDEECKNDYSIPAAVVQYHTVIDVSSKWLATAVKNAAKNGRIVTIMYSPEEKSLNVFGGTDETSSQTYQLKEELVRYDARSLRNMNKIYVRLNTSVMMRYIGANKCQCRDDDTNACQCRIVGANKCRCRDVVRMYMSNDNEFVMSYLLELSGQDMSHPSRMEIWLSTVKRKINDQVGGQMGDQVCGDEMDDETKTSAMDTSIKEYVRKNNQGDIVLTAPSTLPNAVASASVTPSVTSVALGPHDRTESSLQSELARARMQAAAMFQDDNDL
jgi:hypothetical protein